MTASPSSASPSTAPARRWRGWLTILLLPLLLLAVATGGFSWWYSRDPQFTFPSLEGKKDPDEIRRLGAFASALRSQRNSIPDGTDVGNARLQREAAYQRVIQSRSAEQALSQLGGPAYPAEPSWSRRTACWLLRKPIADQSLWVDAFLKTYDDQLAPVEAFYNAVSSRTSARAAGTKGVGFIFRRPRSLPTDAAIAYDRFDTRTDWELWVSQPTAEGADSEQWSGVFLLNQPWHRQGSELRPEWPSAPEELRVQEDACARMLHAGRVPSTFRVRHARARASGTWEKPILDLTFDLVCADFPGWSFPARLQLRSLAPVDELHAETRAIGTRGRDDLESHLLGLKAWKELPIRVERKPMGQSPLLARFSLPDLPPIDLGARLSEEGRLSFESLPDVRTRLELAERVARAEKKLDAYRGRLELTRIQVVPSGSQLRLEFCAVEADRPDSPVVQGIIWEVGSDGKGRVKLPEGFQAVRPNRVVPVSAPENVPDAEEAIRTAALNRLHTAYVTLEDVVEVLVTPGPKGGSLLTLMLTVADLEALQLGPAVAFRAKDVPDIINKLVSQDTVRRAADRQWISRNGPRTRLELKEWNPSTTVAKLAHEICLSQDVKLPWDEEVRLRGKVWDRLSEAEINTMLFSKAEQMLGASPSLRADLGSLVVDVGVNPDYFGTGRWLRLSPLAVAIRAEIEIPVIGFTGEVNDLVIDELGTNWGQAEYHLSWQGTLSLTAFAVSDINVHVRPKQSELEVSACVTPPIPSLPAAVRTSKAKSRASKAKEKAVQIAGSHSNLWLQIAYLQIDIKGRWEERMLSGTAKVVVVGQAVADADMVLDFDKGEFSAKILSGNALPGLEKMPVRLRGAAHWSLKKRLLDASVESSTGALGFAGDITCALDGTEPHLVASGVINCGPGKVRLHGQIHNFDKYSLKGEADFDLLIGKATIVVEIDNHGFRVYRRWKGATGSPELVYEKSTLQDADPDELHAALVGKGTGDGGNPRIGKEVQKPEVFEPTRLDEEGTKPTATADGSVLPQLVAGSKLEFDFPNDYVVITEKKSNDCLLRLQSALLGVKDPDKCEYIYWRQPNRGGDLLVFAPSGDRRVVHAHVGIDGTPAIHDLTEDYRGLSADLFAAELGRASAFRNAVATHFELKTFPGHRAQPSSIRSEAGGYLIEYRQFSSDSNKELQHCQFYWVCDDRSHRAIVYAPFIAPEKRTTAFFRDLTAWTTESGFVIIAAHDPAHSRFSCLTRDAKGDWLLAPDANEPKKVIPIYLTHGVGKPFQGANVLASACFAPDGSPRIVKRAWVGPQGVCAEVNDGWLLMRLAEEKPVAVHLTRARFDRWEKDSQRFLPPAWREADYRKRLSSTEVARVAIADWQQLRASDSEPGWSAANPLGLLQDLAQP